jgi:hypothetical protein
MKFAVSADVAQAVQAWALAQMNIDPHAGPNGSYQITSVYYDTPDFSVFRRAPGYEIHKYRVRRYGTESIAHLERKSKQDGRVWKHRSTVPLAVLDQPMTEWGVPWFIRELTELNQRPVCVVTYQRMAFVSTSPTGPIRLTMDRFAIGSPVSQLILTPVSSGVPLLTDEVVVECKYLAMIPGLFKVLIETQQLTPTGLSKYRRCARAAGLVTEPDPTTPYSVGEAAV